VHGKLNGEVARHARHRREDHREDVGRVVHVGEDVTRSLRGCYEETASVACRDLSGSLVACDHGSNCCRQTGAFAAIQLLTNSACLYILSSAAGRPAGRRRRLQFDVRIGPIRVTAGHVYVSRRVSVALL